MKPAHPIMVAVFVALVTGIFLTASPSPRSTTPLIQSVQAQTTTNWPQLQNNPQHTGRSTYQFSAFPTQKVWAFNFAGSNIALSRKPEKLWPQTQPVVVGNQLYIGTTNGTFYCFNASTGSILWTYNDNGNLGGVIGTAAVDSNKVFFGSLNGNVYALNTADGSLAWKFQSGQRSGFGSAVIVAENKVFVNNRAGTLFALNPSTGAKELERAIGEPIFASMAYNLYNSQGRLYFGTMKMKVYAVNTQNFQNVFNPVQVRGLAIKDYWPVVHQGYVIIRVMKEWGDNSWDALGGISHYELPATTKFSASQLHEQGNQLTAGQYSGQWQDMYVFSENNWSQLNVPHYATHTMNGAVCPPSIDQYDNLVVPTAYNHDGESSGWWGRLKLNAQYTYNGSVETGPRIIYAPVNLGGAIHQNGDESNCTSTAGTYSFHLHTQEQNAGWSGTWNLIVNQGSSNLVDDDTLTTNTTSGRIGPYYTSNYDYLYVLGTQGGGNSSPVIANGMLYHTTQNNLNARR